MIFKMVEEIAIKLRVLLNVISDKYIFKFSGTESLFC